jgi:uncharacterized protein DUF4242
MPKYVIEREMPGLGDLSEADLQAASAKSNGVLRDMGGDVQWVHSYVTQDKMYCVYVAPSEARVLEHAECGGFPANTINRVSTTIEPITAESHVAA